MLVSRPRSESWTGGDDGDPVLVVLTVNGSWLTPKALIPQTDMFPDVNCSSVPTEAVSCGFRRGSCPLDLL